MSAYEQDMGLGSSRGEECEPHTPCPDGYVARFEWAEKMSKTHRQRQCKGCGLWAVWEDQRFVEKVQP